MTVRIGSPVFVEPGRLSGETMVDDRTWSTALARRERFAAYVAHELRGPIALQRTLVEVALADPDADTSMLREMGLRVMSALEHQQRLIDGLLDLTRIQPQLSTHKPVDLSAVATEALRAHDLTDIASIVRVHTARTSGDASLLTQLASNLISNAVRHNIPRGLIKLTTGTAQRRAFLTVANTGPSIPPRELDRLFQPFHRLTPHRREHTQGLGLGLTIVQSIAEAHRAFIDVRARAGGGLVVRVSFPKAQPPPHR